MTRKSRAPGAPDATTLTQDEDPSPAMVSPDAVHLPDRAREQAAECAREGRGRVEEREALLRLLAAVPHRDHVAAPGEEARLCEPEEEARGDESAEVLREALEDGDEPEDEHA